MRSHSVSLQPQGPEALLTWRRAPGRCGRSAVPTGAPEGQASKGLDVRQRHAGCACAQKPVTNILTTLNDIYPPGPISASRPQV
ncbi:hypothetical protein CB1_000164022 [Camelus ferus]|nr:hypothetical protein CB1_000164022 [Camelus ferus]